VKRLKQQVTKDNSITLFNETYQEYYHSTKGAVEESFEKFVKPCRIAELAKTGKIRILDVCFGVGYNSAAAIDAALESNPNCEIEIIGLENDQKILDEIKNLNPAFKYYDIIKGDKSDPKIKLKILLGDARETIKQVKDKVDAVFFDPFSPKVCPELWTKEFFADIKRVMTPGAILTTYSCARIVRDNMKANGFIVKDGPILGRRGPATIAIAGSGCVGQRN
jgi:tRNA U34 5-methylaminomethyl-2-thiouridine-forming methyltransferase MnmC